MGATDPTPNAPSEDQATIDDYLGSGPSSQGGQVPEGSTVVDPADYDQGRQPGDVWPREVATGGTTAGPGDISPADALAELGFTNGQIQRILLGQGGAGAKKVNPVVQSLTGYYIKLYGKLPPSGYIPGLLKAGGDLYSIRNDLLAKARGDEAPGYEDVRYQQLLQSGAGVYFQLWGEDAPPNYVKDLIGSGMNLQEIAANERMKPAFKNTETYKQDSLKFAGQLASLLGTG